MCQACLNSGFHQSAESTNPLMANAWASFVPTQIDDGVVHVSFDKEEPKAVKKYIRQLIKDTDAVTGIKVARGSEALADVNLYGVESWKGDLAPYNNTAAGLAFWDAAEGNADGTWRNTYIRTEDYTFINKRGKEKTKQRLSSYSKRLITHEFFHTMGLSHPEDNGYAAGYDGSTTTMSYNRRELWDGMTDLDVTALQQIWGAPTNTL